MENFVKFCALGLFISDNIKHFAVESFDNLINNPSAQNFFHKYSGSINFEPMVFIILSIKSGQCFCSNWYGTYGLSTNCNKACNGNSNEICGGSWANSVYSTQCPQRNFLIIIFS